MVSAHNTKIEARWKLRIGRSSNAFVVNYVNNGLQFFLADGTFYREVRVAAPNAPLVPISKQWLPIRSTKKSPESPKQLDDLISKFTDTEGGKGYLTKFIDMATNSIDHLTNRMKLEWFSQLSTQVQPESKYRRTSIICTIGMNTSCGILQPVDKSR